MESLFLEELLVLHLIKLNEILILQIFLGAMHIPEKWFPGCLDFYLNSHNIMHILVVLAVYSMHQVN